MISRLLLTLPIGPSILAVDLGVWRTTSGLVFLFRHFGVEHEVFWPVADNKNLNEPLVTVYPRNERERVMYVYEPLGTVMFLYVILPSAREVQR